MYSTLQELLLYVCILTKLAIHEVISPPQIKCRPNYLTILRTMLLYALPTYPLFRLVPCYFMSAIHMWMYNRMHTKPILHSQANAG